MVSGFDATGTAVKYIAAPTLKSVKNTVSGVKITWNARSGAVKYRVLRKAENSTVWVRVGDTAKTSYVDKKASSGTTYTYTVRCVSSDGKSMVSGYNAKGKTIRYIAAPVLKSAKNTAAGRVKIAWKASAGAVRYRVLRKTAGGSWEILGYTKSTSYTDKTVKKGVTYYYTVRCVTASGKSATSAYNATGKKVTVKK